MKSLCLEGNTVGVEAAEAIAGALEKHPEFQVSPKTVNYVYRSRDSKNPLVCSYLRASETLDDFQYKLIFFSIFATNFCDAGQVLIAFEIFQGLQVIYRHVYLIFCPKA